MLKRLGAALIVLALAVCYAFGQTSVRLQTPPGVIVSNACGSAVSSCVLKAAPGQFYGVYAECTAICYVMVFNSVAAPSNGSTTAGPSNVSGNMVECFEIATANTSKSLTYLPYSTFYSVGITIAISSTACTSLTLSTVGFVSGVFN